MRNKWFLSFIATLLSVIAISTTAQADTLYDDLMVDKHTFGIIEQYADEYEVDKFVLYAMVESESSGKQYAENGSCKGLLQINENVWSSVMDELEITDIFDIESNIQLGAYILRYYLDKSDNYAEALMRYNGSKIISGKISKYARKILKRSYTLHILENQLWEKLC